MHKPLGYTSLDLVTAGILVTVVAVLIVFLANPKAELERQHDLVREADVWSITKNLVQLQFSSPDEFAFMLEQIGDERTMIGTANNCEGSFGTQCQDALLSDTCVPISEYFPTLEGELPIDPTKEPFMSARTGYYLEKRGDTLKIGSCNPEHRPVIELEVEIGM